MQLLVLGYYGFGNFGDELILSALQEELSSVDCNAVFAANNPGQYHSIITSRQSWVDRHDRSAMLATLAASDMIMLGGGGLVQDVTSWRSSLYYLGIPFAGLLRHKKVIAYAQGIGPLVHSWSRWFTKTVFSGMSLIDVRDEASCDLLVRCGVSSSRINISGDLGLPYLVKHKQKLSIDTHHGIIACVNPRFGWNSSETALFLDIIASHANGEITLVVLFPASDLEFSQAVHDRLHGSSSIIIAPDPDKLLKLCTTACTTVAGRYHMAVAGIAAQSSVVALAYDPKIAQLGASYGFSIIQPGVSPEQAAAHVSGKETLPISTEKLLQSLQTRAERISRLSSIVADRHAE